jgi:hypothetical protein
MVYTINKARDLIILYVEATHTFFKRLQLSTSDTCDTLHQKSRIAILTFHEILLGLYKYDSINVVVTRMSPFNRSANTLILKLPTIDQVTFTKKK